MVAILVIDEFPAISEVNYEYFVGLFSQTCQEVLWVDVIIYEVFGMYPLYSVDKLIRNY